MANEPGTSLQPDQPERDDSAQAEPRVVNTQGDGSISIRDISGIGIAVGEGAKADVRIVTEEQAYNVVGLPNPYLGLGAFTYDDQEKFAGRDHEIAASVALLTTPGAQRTLLFVTGASGSGKSSFAQAGLLPALEAHYRQRHFAVQRAVLRPSHFPLASLIDALQQLQLPTGQLASEDLLKQPGYLAQLVQHATPAQQVNLIVLDQFEELFTQSEPVHRDALFTILEQLPPFATLRTHIIVTMRSDYLPELFEGKALYEIAKGGVDLRAMESDELKQAIQRPLQKESTASEKHFQPALLERLVRDAAGDAARLPLLQVTLTDLWQDGSLQLLAYKGLANAIQRRADAVYAYHDYDGLKLKQRVPEEQAAILNLFLELVRVPLDDKQHDVRWRRPRAELIQGKPQRERLIADLATARLLRTDREAIQENGQEREVETVDIIHEALLSGWPTLKEAIDLERETLRQGVRFDLAVTEWLAHKQHDDYLLTGVRLAEAEALKQRNDSVFWRNGAQEFYTASIQWRDAEKQRELEQAKRLTDAAEARAVAEARARKEAEARANDQRTSNHQLRRRAQWIAIAALGALVFAGLSVWFGVTAQQREVDARNNEATAIAEQQRADAQAATAVAERQRADAQAATAVAERQRVEQQGRITSARQLAGLAQSELEEHPQRSLLLAIEALKSTLDYDEPPIESAEEALRDALVAVQGVGLGGQSGPIEDIAFSPDGRFLALGNSRDNQENPEGTISLWDMTMSDPSLTRRVLPGHPNTTRVVAFSPDSRLLASIGDGSGGKVWSLVDLNALPVDLNRTSSVSPLAFSPDSHWLATAGNNNEVYLWNVQDLTTQIVPQTLTGHTSDVNFLSFAQNGQWLISAAEGDSDQEGAILLWDLTTPTPTATPIALIAPGRNNRLRIAVSNDSNWLATSTSIGGLVIWDMSKVHDSSKPIPVAEGTSTEALAFSKDNRWLATSSQVFDVATLKSTPKLITLPQPMPRIAFSHDGHLLIGANTDGSIKVWEFPHLWERASLQAPEGSLDKIVVSPDDHWLVASGLFGDRTARLWDLRSRSIANPLDPMMLHEHEDDVTVAAISHRWVAIAGSADFTDPALRNGTVNLYDRQNLSNSSIVLQGHKDIVKFIVFSPNDRWMVTVSNVMQSQQSLPEINLWDLPKISNQALPLALKGPQQGEVNAVVLSRDHHWLAIGGSDRQGVRLWNLSGDKVNSIPIILPATEAVSALAMSPNGKELAAGYQDGRIRVYSLDPPNPSPRLILEGHQAKITTLIFSSSSKWLVSGSEDHTGHLWPVTAVNPGAEGFVLPGHTAAVTAVDISDDESLIVTGSEDGTARVWRLTQTNIQEGVLIVKGHEGPIYFVAFMENGSKLVTASIKPGLYNADGTVRIWSLSPNSTASASVQLRHGQSKIVSVAIDPDGHWILTGGEDQTARLWTVNIRHLIGYACRAAGRSLTATEWGIYLPNRSYQATCSQFPVQTAVSLSPTPVPTLTSPSNTPVPTLPPSNTTSTREMPRSTEVITDLEPLNAQDTAYVERVSDHISRTRRAISHLNELLAGSAQGNEDVTVAELKASMQRVETLLSESESIQPTERYLKAHTKYKGALSSVRYALDQLYQPAEAAYRLILDDYQFLTMIYDLFSVADHELEGIWD